MFVWFKEVGTVEPEPEKLIPKLNSYFEILNV